MINQILFFLLNGVGTLMLETAWLKKQVALFGASPGSYGSILFAYFVGISLGSWFFRKKHTAAVSPLFLYGGFLSALLLSLFLPSLLYNGLPFPPEFVFGQPLLYKTIIWFLAIIAIVPACFFLGGFFPLIAQTVSRENFVLLYGVQTFGAFLGIFLGAFYLPYTVGYLITFFCGIAINAASLLFFRQTVRGRTPGGISEPEGQTGSLRPIVLSFSSGFFSLLLQVLWIRFIALGTDNSIYAFGSASLIILMQLSCSSAITSRLPSSWFRSRNTFNVLSVLSVTGILFSTWIYREMTNGLAINSVTNAAGLFSSLRFAAFFILIGYLFPSFVFPSLLRSFSTDGKIVESGSSTVGIMIASNGLGCAAGSFLASFVFLPKLGMWVSLIIAVSGYACFPLLLERTRSRVPAVAICIVVIFIFHPMRYPLVTPTNPTGGPPGSVVSVKEGKYGIISVIDYGNSWRSLWLNNTYLLEAGVNDIRATYRIGLIPAVLNPNAKSVEMIGVGTGISASAFLETAASRITLIEIIPEVVEAASEHFRFYNDDVLRNPRVKTIIADGRHYLKIQKDTFDIICSDLFIPWNEGSAYLYTVDHFRNVKAKLNPGGLFCLWLPLAQMTKEEFLIVAKSFSTVFPNTTMWQSVSRLSRNAAVLVGTEKIRTEAIVEYFRGRSRVAALRDPFIQSHESGIFSRYVGPVVPSNPRWKSLPLNTLDRPVIEFKAAQRNRVRLQGQEIINLFEEFYRLPGNPDGRYFSYYDEYIESYRLAGRYLGLASYFASIGDLQRAEEFHRKGLIPAIFLSSAPSQK